MNKQQYLFIRKVLWVTKDLLVILFLLIKALTIYSGAGVTRKMLIGYFSILNTTSICIKYVPRELLHLNYLDASFALWLTCERP
jgi:hypothetical protein